MLQKNVWILGIGAVLVNGWSWPYPKLYPSQDGTTGLKDSFKLPGSIFLSMDLHEAVDPHPRGCVIRFEVVAGSSRLVVPSGFNPWRRALEARLIEEPMRGRANRQLIGEVAKVLGVSESEVEVLSGHKSARKVLLVKGITAEQAVSILSLKDPNGLWKDAA